MINGLEGIPGSGKSYEATVYHVLEALKRGRLVVTNLPLNVAMFTAIDPGYASLIEIRTRPRPIRGSWDANRMDDQGNGRAFELFEDGHTAEPAESVAVFGHVWDYFHEWKHPETGLGPLFIIDECHLALPPTGTDVQVVQWFKLHRHFNADVLLMTQSFRDMNQAIARLMAMLVRCRKADFLGKPDHYVRKVHAGLRGAVVSTEQRKYLPQYFPLYKSHTQGNSVSEASAGDVSPFIVKWKRATWAFWITGILVCVYLFWPKDKPPKPPARNPAVSAAPAPLKTEVHTSANQAQSVPQTQAVQEPPPPPSDPEPYADRGLHLKGTMRAGDRVVYLFAASQNGQAFYTLTDRDLVAAGYVFRPLGECAGMLEWKGKSRPVICDAPTHGLMGRS